MARQSPPKGQIETMAPPAQQYPQPPPPPQEQMAPPPMYQRNQPPPMYQQRRQPQMMGYDDEDYDYDYDYMSDEDMSPKKRRFMKGKPSQKGKCNGKSPSNLPWIIYLIIVGLSFFGLLFSKQSMMGNLGLIVLQFIITVVIIVIVYNLSKRCQTVAALVVIIVALVIQLFLVAAAGIWPII